MPAISPPRTREEAVIHPDAACSAFLAALTRPGRAAAAAIRARAALTVAKQTTLALAAGRSKPLSKTDRAEILAAAHDGSSKLGEMRRSTSATDGSVGDVALRDAHPDRQMVPRPLCSASP
jgi:hypothetical protein